MGEKDILLSIFNQQAIQVRYFHTRWQHQLVLLDLPPVC